MNNHSPRDNFQKFNEAEAQMARAAAPSKQMQTWIDAALAEFSHRGASTEQLSGANKFIGIFLNLGEPEEEPTPRYPERELKSY